MLNKIFVIIMSAVLFQACVNTDYILDPEIEQKLGKINIQSSKQALKINESLQLSAELLDESNNLVENVSVSWRSSDNSIILIDEEGFAEAKKQGQVWIFAMAEGFKKDSTILSVVEDANKLASITISPSATQFEVGQTIQFSAAGKTVDGTNIQVTSFQWSSSDPSTVSIDNSGLATAEKPGNVQIYASAEGIQSNSVAISVGGQTKTGTFMPRPGSSYRVSGSAELLSQGNSLVLNFGSDFTTSNGPDLRVYLSPGERIGSGSIELGKLKSTSGEQTYGVPSGHSLDNFNYVIIHCVPFNVSFGQAFIQ